MEERKVPLTSVAQSRHSRRPFFLRDPCNRHRLRRAPAAEVKKKPVKALLSRLSWSKYLCEKSGLIQLENKLNWTTLDELVQYDFL